MRKAVFSFFMFCCAVNCIADGTIVSNRINTLQVTAGYDFLSPAVIGMSDNEAINISFDEMSHDYHRLVYHIEHCNPDWTTSSELLESDYLEGFNDIVIDDYQNSINTTVLYTHYSFSIPNDKCRLKLSGNYRVTVMDDDTSEKLLEARFMILDAKTTIDMKVTTNTDIELNKSQQQLSMTVNYSSLNIINPEEQIYTIITQNERLDNQKTNVKPNMRNNNELIWQHNRDLIFDGGNEYRKFEILALTHPTMGIDEISWDGSNYHAHPFTAEPRHNYIYDEDANGAFYIRNSDNIENDITCDYVYVDYKLTTGKRYYGDVVIDGKWTNHADKERYTTTYDEEDDSYKLRLLQKQGYYSYQYLVKDDNGKTSRQSSVEGNFHQTENRYQAYVYYKGQGQRHWSLVGFRQLQFR